MSKTNSNVVMGVPFGQTKGFIFEVKFESKDIPTSIYAEGVCLNSAKRQLSCHPEIANACPFEIVGVTEMSDSDDTTH